MKNFIKCALCFGISEYELLDMKLCTYHFILLNNNLFSKDGNDRISELMRLLD